MQIVLVQPTDLAPSYMTEDFWDCVDERGLEQLKKLGCKTDTFPSFFEAETFIDSLDMSDSYKTMLYERLDELKKEVDTFNWAVV